MPVAQTIRHSRWLLPAIETAHLLGYSVLIGTIVTVDLRLLGLGVRRQTASQIACKLAPWTLGSLGLAIGTGLLLFSYDPMKFYANKVFPFKVAFLVAAVGFHYLVFPRVSGRNVLATGLSLGLWLGVALAGLGLSLEPF